MRQRVHLITLGVTDVSRASHFYGALGWKKLDLPPGMPVVFNLYGAALGLFDRSALENEIGKPLAPGSGSQVLSQNTRSEAEVDEMVRAASEAGGTILRKPRKAIWGGYHGHFEDLDGHIWEVAFNPFSPLDRHDAFQWATA